jgi:hypothetical protein
MVASEFEEKTVSRNSEQTDESVETVASAQDVPAPAERGMSLVDETLLEMANSAAATGETGDETALDLPSVDIFATQWTEFDLRCRDCQVVHYVPICLFVNAEESPAVVQRIISEHFNLKRCPVCRQFEYVEHPYCYYDPARKLIVQVRPEWEWHAGGGDEWYAARLVDLFDKWAEHDVKIEVVFGPQQLIDRFLQDVPPPPARR